MANLLGHTSPETAYVVDDYPYGFRLRTSIRYWIETKRPHGQRFVSQTRNPKNGRWNAPKPSTYSPIVVMWLDADEHVQHTALSAYADEAQIDAFEAANADALTEQRERELIRYFRAHRRAETHVTWSIHTCTPGNCDRPELHEESWRDKVKREAGLLHEITVHEMKKETFAAMRGEVYP
jgi:hypothetical protein